MRHDLLRSLAEEEEITNAVILTHNIDFVFLQTVVLSTLRRCGYPSLTVFADAGCASSAYAQQARVLHGLGVRYRVVPVEMDRGFRFHPKAILLSGAAYGALFVGSGNLTFGGWRENAEVWLRFDTRTDGTGAVAAFLRYLHGVLARVPLPEAIRAEIEEAYDPKTRAWAGALSEPESLIGKIGNQASLLQQMFMALGNARVDRLTICAPYCDEEGDALRTLVRGVEPSPAIVCVQPAATGLTERAWSGAGATATLSTVRFHRENDQGQVREAFIHAKFYAFEHQDRVTLFLGSANCSQAALTIPGPSGNAELLAMREMSADEFRAFLAELVIEEDRPTLAEERVQAPSPAQPVFRVLRASHEAGYLRVAWSPLNWEITACELDGQVTSFERIAAGVVGVSTVQPPRQVLLIGTDADGLVQSARAWVDHEWQLRSTARGRSVAEAIHNRVRSGEWGIGGWTEVVEIFCSHLRYLPPRFGTHSGPGSTRKTATPTSYSAKDVFGSDYSLPSIGALVRSLPSSPDGRVRSLQQLLLRWFGVATPNEEEEVEEEVAPPGDEEEAVDRPQKLKKRAIRLSVPEPTDADKRRAQRLIGQLSDAMTNDQFLERRPPEFLAADLRVASALLRIGLRQKWVDEALFFRVTHAVWSSLFFAGSGGQCRLASRREAAASPEAFAKELSSPDVVAALAGWMLGVESDCLTPEHARFALAATLAIARLPWLWDGVDDKAFCGELAELVTYTEVATEAIEWTANGLTTRWLQTVRRGHALRRLESVLTGQLPTQLSPKVPQQALSAGDLLWQGSAGFCVAMEATPRHAGQKVRVLRLEGGRHESEFAAQWTVPIAALLDERVLPVSDTFGAPERGVLGDFLAELANGFRRGRNESTNIKHPR